MKCLVCNKECKSLMGLGVHIHHKHGINSKTYYDEYLKKENDGICKQCGKSTRFKNLTGYNLTCSYSCASLYIQKDIQKQSLIKYGTTHPLKSKEVRQKIEKTNFIKYGSFQVFQSDNFKRKSINTWKSKYGVSNPQQNKNIRQKFINTLLNNYGVTSAHKSHIIRQKFYTTMMAKYGVLHALQDPSLFNNFIKHSYSLKLYVLPSKRKVYIQGFEDRFLDHYFSLNQPENDIIIHPKNLNLKYLDDFQKMHFYFPDFLIISKREIIEVKSWYTLEYDKNIDKKVECSIQNGYSFRLFFPVGE